MDKLQQVENELIILQSEIKKLKSKEDILLKERRTIIQSNCKHEFEWTGYCEDDLENNIIEYQMECKKCYLIEWDKV
jgi:hypothetical protein